MHPPKTRVNANLQCAEKNLTSAQQLRYFPSQQAREVQYQQMIQPLICQVPFSVNYLKSNILLCEWENSVDKNTYFERRWNQYSVFHWDVSCGKYSDITLTKIPRICCLVTSELVKFDQSSDLSNLWEAGFLSRSILQKKIPRLPNCSVLNLPTSKIFG